MAPSTFLQSPLRWLKAVTRYRATTSGGPNFAYDLCCRRATTADLEDLDLRSWRIAFNGAEPVRAETLARFASARAAGLTGVRFSPCYGLAEATLMVSGAGGTRVRRFRAAELAGGRAIRAKDQGTRAAGRDLVSCGRPLGDQRLVVVEPQAREAVGSGRISKMAIGR